MKDGETTCRPERSGFTLVELLVVIGIITLLIAMLLPALNKARDQANSLSCQSNLRQLAMLTLNYVSNNNGWFPYCSNYPTDPNRQEDPWWTYIAKNSPTDNSSTAVSLMQKCPGTISLYRDANYHQLMAVGQDTTAGYSGATLAVETTYYAAVNVNMCVRNDYWVPQEPAPPSTNWTPMARGKKISQFHRTSQLMLAADSDGYDFTGGWNPMEHIRFRHNKGQVINLVFLDGHAESWEYHSCEGDPVTDKTYDRNLFSAENDTDQDGLSWFAYLPWGEYKVPEH